MKTLILILAFALSAFPYKYMNIIIDHEKVTETATDFLYQFDLSDSIDVIEDEITDETNIIVCVPGDTATKYPRYIHYIVGKHLLLYVSAPKSSTVDDTLQVCFGSEFAAVNATSTFTNNNITNYYGFDRFSGNTFYDYTNSNDGTGTGVDTVSARFGVGGNFTGSGDNVNLGNVTSLSDVTAFAIQGVVKFSDYDASHYVLQRQINTSTRISVYVTTGNLFYVLIRGNESTSVIQFDDINTIIGTTNFVLLSICYNGSLTEAERTTVWVNGTELTRTVASVQQTTAIPDLSSVSAYIGNTATTQANIIDEFAIYNSSGVGNVPDRYSMLFDTLFYSVGAMTLVGTLQLDSVGISQFITWGTFPTIDSAYVNLAKATINGANGDSLLITAASPLMWRRETYPITLYSGVVPYTFPYHYLTGSSSAKYFFFFGGQDD